MEKMCHQKTWPFLPKRLGESWHQTEPRFPFLPNVAGNLFSYPLITCAQPIQVLRRKMQREPIYSFHSFKREAWGFPIVRTKIDPELHWLQGVSTKCRLLCLSCFIAHQSSVSSSAQCLKAQSLESGSEPLQPVTSDKSCHLSKAQFPG